MLSKEEADLKSRWEGLCSKLKIKKPLVLKWWQTISVRYNEPQRRYHTLKHVHEMFVYRDKMLANLRDVDAVDLAIIFHDIIYEPRAQGGKNEDDSADVFREFAAETNVFSPGFVMKVARWIEVTKHHKVAEDEDEDCKYFMDFDMAILGQPPEVYDEYSAQIRVEYSHLPLAFLCRGRADFLSATASGASPIYATSAFRATYEQVARSNMAREAAETLPALAKTCSLPARVAAPVVMQLMGLKRRVGRHPWVLGAVAAAAPVAVRSGVSPVNVLSMLALLTTVLVGQAAGRTLANFRARPFPYRSTGPASSVAVFAASFDPPHKGHLAMLKHLSQTHQTVIAAVAVNPAKKYRVPAEARRRLLESSVAAQGMANVRPVVWTDYPWRAAQGAGASTLHRGIRSWGKDGVSEKWLEFLNLVSPPLFGASPVSTQYLQADPSYAHVSSTLVRNMVASGTGKLSDLICHEIVADVQKLYKGE